MKAWTATVFLALSATSLSACSEDHDYERFVGRWASDRGWSILQIEPAQDGYMRVAETWTPDGFHPSRTDDVLARMEDGELVNGSSNSGQSIIFDETRGHLAMGGRSYQPVPEGWTWRDGRPEADS